MRQYKSRFLKAKFQRYLEDKKESQDAVVHSIDMSQRVCGVRIQGSDNLIRAYYPENWEKLPFWCKVRNCVRIQHCGGNRGRSEVLGMGILRPTPTLDSTVGDPSDTAVLEDGVISGLDVLEIPYGDLMKVMITVGEARFGGASATSGAIRMESTNYKIGMGGLMGNVKAIKDINAAPLVGTFRYDLISMSSDLIVDYAAGGVFTATAIYPATAAGHIVLANILVPSCVTSIDNNHINQSWNPPSLNRIQMSLNDTDLSWAESSAIVTVNLIDQYNSPFTPANGSPVSIKLSIESGKGVVNYSVDTSTAYVSGMTTSTNITFGYTRHGATSGSNIDQSPLLKAEIISQTLPSDYEYIILRDSGGTILTS